MSHVFVSTNALRCATPPHSADTLLARTVNLLECEHNAFSCLSHGRSRDFCPTQSSQTMNNEQRAYEFQINVVTLSSIIFSDNACSQERCALALVLCQPHNEQNRGGPEISVEGAEAHKGELTQLENLSPNNMKQFMPWRPKVTTKPILRVGGRPFPPTHTPGSAPCRDVNKRILHYGIKADAHAFPTRIGSHKMSARICVDDASEDAAGGGGRPEQCFPPPNFFAHFLVLNAKCPPPVKLLKKPPPV